jgi:hypothetical protein
MKAEAAAICSHLLRGLTAVWIGANAAVVPADTTLVAVNRAKISLE